MPIQVVSLIHQVHGHRVEARSREQLYVDDGSPVNWEKLRPCAACGLCIGKDDHDPCIANLPGTVNACCGHGLPDEESQRRVVQIGDDGKLSIGVEKSVLSWGYVELEDGRRIEFSGTCGGDRIRQAVDAALNGHPLPERFRYAH